MSEFFSPFAKTIFEQKYAHTKEDGTKETWEEVAYRVSKHVFKSVNAKKSLVKDAERFIKEKKFMPGGRYAYAAGRPFHQVQNCLLLRAKDSREGWAELLSKASMALMTGAGIGIDYSDVRAEGKAIRRTGGTSTGPLALTEIVNAAGRGIVQGGSRRCQKYDTLVLTTDGWKEIKDVKIGDKVLFNGEEIEVLNNFDNGIQEIVKIELEDGSFFECTEEHRWYVFNHDTNECEWIITKDLENGEYSMMSPIAQDIKSITLTKIVKINKTKEKAQVYDIEVNSKEHAFIAKSPSGAIGISHNSAIWAGLNWNHPDIMKFITAKNWSEDIMKMKEKDFNFPAPFDGTNISVQLDDLFFTAFNNEKHVLHSHAHCVYWAVVESMMKNGEPGFSVDIKENAGETLRNACCEISSKDSDDICNLGSVNLANINSLEEMKEVVEVATAFLLAGTVYSDVPYVEVDQVRTKNRRLGLGLMGIHEWLLSHGKKYGPDSELEEYMKIYAGNKEYAEKYAKEWDLSVPVKCRAIAPNGTIGIVAETTTGIEPIFCVAYKRRYMKGNVWNYQYVIDPTAKRLIAKGVNPNTIEDAYSLSHDVERRMEFQSWVQSFVDHGISSTINLPQWGSEANNHTKIQSFGNMLMKYLPTFRGITCFPDGGRGIGAQPLNVVKYETAVKHEGDIFVEGGSMVVETADVCSITRGGASCGD